MWDKTCFPEATYLKKKFKNNVVASKEHFWYKQEILKTVLSVNAPTYMYWHIRSVVSWKFGVDNSWCVQNVICRK